jgi:hypothetical protein
LGKYPSLYRGPEKESKLVWTVNRAYA